MKIQASKKQVSERKPLQRLSNVALPPKTASVKPSKSTRPSLQKDSSSSHRRRYSLMIQVPLVSSKHWCLYEGSRVLEGLRDQQQVEVASLTKIMTLTVSLHLIDSFNVPFDEIVTVSQLAASTTGTTASLKPGDRIPLWDLFFGLMLPSGNDASVALAEHLGKYLGEDSPKQNFIRQMNLLAIKLGMAQTHYQNPHGLMIERNLSTARDTCKLAAFALENSTFCEIVGTQSYKGRITDAGGNVRTQEWTNTNQMLGRGFYGVKTGVTDNAGPCLCVSKKLPDGKTIVTTILNCRSMDARWHEVNKLTTWATRKFFEI